jgi:hypothetical protein
MLLVGTLTTTAMVCPRALHAQRGERIRRLADWLMNSASPPSSSTGSR